MSNQLRDCAEQILGAIIKTDTELGPCYTVNDTGCNGLSEPYELAVAYLAEHPADDDEPVTEEWFRREIGQGSLVCDDEYFAITFRILKQQSGTERTVWFEAIDVDDQRSLLVREFSTRGQVRLLCKALGIESRND